MTDPCISVATGTDTVWVLGDTQDDNDQYTALDTALGLMLQATPSPLGFVCVGDLVQNGAEAEYTALSAILVKHGVDSTWATSPIFASAVGGHEEIEDATLTRFYAMLTGQANTTPAPFLTPNGARYRAFTLGTTRWIFLSEDAVYSADEQAFVDDELGLANACGLTPIIVSHYDCYSTTTYAASNRDDLVLPYTQAAEDAGVRLWLSGHTHLYERTNPMLSGAVNAAGIHHIQCGAQLYQDSFAFVENKNVVLNGAPNVVRTEDWYAVDDGVLAATQSGSLSYARGFNRLDVSVSALTWRAYELQGSTLVQFDSVEISL